MHAGDASRWHPDYRLPPSQEYAEAFLLHWRMEATCYYPAVVAPGGDYIKGFQNHAAWALRGAKESCFLTVENLNGSGSPY
jgi:hypothetical protein